MCSELTFTLIILSSQDTAEERPNITALTHIATPKAKPDHELVNNPRRIP